VTTTPDLTAAGCTTGVDTCDLDLLSHAQSINGHHLQALDGVTTALDLEVGALPVAASYDVATAEERPLNYGFSAS
jgi:hypothetical protein